MKTVNRCVGAPIIKTEDAFNFFIMSIRFDFVVHKKHCSKQA